MTLLEQYTKACEFTGTVNEQRVEASLTAYCEALGVKRKIKRLRAGWSLETEPELKRSIDAILEDFAKRNALSVQAAQAARAALAARAARAARDSKAARDARAARAARDALAARDARDARDAQAALDARDAQAALDARDALAARAAEHRFAEWCVYCWSGWWTGDISWLSTTYLGSLQTGALPVQLWSKHVFEAFINGAWLLYWTEDTLYWVANAPVKTEIVNGVKRLHCADGPALLCDVENLYFWHGTMVPDFVITKPELITLNHIDTETNAEVRRVMIDKYGQGRYLTDSGAEQIHSDRFGVLYRKTVPNDEVMVMVKVVNSTAESDGTRKEYFLRVPPNITTAHEAVAWGFPYGPEMVVRTPAQYAPSIET